MGKWSANPKDKKEWEKYFDEQVKKGNGKKRGGMLRVPDAGGMLFQRNGQSCCGCGHHDGTVKDPDNWSRAARTTGKPAKKRGWFS